MAESDPEVTSFDQKWPLQGCGRLKSGVSDAFKLVHGCNSQEVAVIHRKLCHMAKNEQK